MADDSGSALKRQLYFQQILLEARSRWLRPNEICEIIHNCKPCDLAPVPPNKPPALGEGMVDDGYRDVVNTDISSVVIEAMQKKYQDKPELKYIKMDARDMTDFESSTFDAVVDKGTLDSLMCGHNAQQNAAMMLEEVGRVLKDKGVYILITYGDPTYRLRLLRELHLWTISIHVIDRTERSSEQRTWELTRPLPLTEDGSVVSSILGQNPEVHYIYVCTKDESLRQHRIRDQDP